MAGLPVWGLEPAVTAGAVCVALAWDVAWGEPPRSLHPVVMMGRYLGWMGARIAPTAGAVPAARAAYWRGACAWCLGAVLVLAVVLALVCGVQRLPPVAQALLLGILLKPLLAWRMLRDEVRTVEAALAQSLQAARARVAYLVSRDVRTASAVQVRQAALSTLAENLNDSVVAPLFWFAVAGLPGAALYRFANTADAMWGYRGVHAGRDWTWAGRWAARADDALSWLPARLTAALLWLAAGGLGGRGLRAQARRTPSPNGGWPMGALALALGIRLDKPGVYTLNPRGRVPVAADSVRALRLCARAVGLLVALAVAVVAWRVPAAMGVWS